MNTSLEDLLQTIGELTVERRLLQKQVSALSKKLEELLQEEEKEDKKEK